MASDPTVRHLLETNILSRRSLFNCCHSFLTKSWFSFKGTFDPPRCSPTHLSVKGWWRVLCPAPPAISLRKVYRASSDKLKSILPWFVVPAVFLEKIILINDIARLTTQSAFSCSYRALFQISFRPQFQRFLHCFFSSLSLHLTHCLLASIYSQSSSRQS